MRSCEVIWAWNGPKEEFLQLILEGMLHGAPVRLGRGRQRAARSTGQASGTLAGLRDPGAVPQTLAPPRHVPNSATNSGHLPRRGAPPPDGPPPRVPWAGSLCSGVADTEKGRHTSNSDDVSAEVVTAGVVPPGIVPPEAAMISPQ